MKEELKNLKKLKNIFKKERCKNRIRKNKKWNRKKKKLQKIFLKLI